MADNRDSSELTIGQSLELQLLAMNALIETLAEYGAPDPYYEQVRGRLLALKDQLRRKQIQPEYAEVQLHAIRDELDKRYEDNRIPDD